MSGVMVLNQNLHDMSVDVLYHFGLATDTSNFKKQFGSIRFVVMGGSAKRMKAIAELLLQELKIELSCGTGLVNIACTTDRYEMYKVGSILLVSHGMGIPSISILLHEMAKLLYHAGCVDVRFIRLGTCGGLGLEPGSVVVTTDCVDGCFNNYLQLNILGKTVNRPAVLDADFVQELIKISKSINTDFCVTSGRTMCANDFYEGQGRLDGAICDYTKQDKMDFLKKSHEMGIRNIEMESLGFAAFCNHLKIKAAVMCVTLVDRLVSDQIECPHHILHQWQERPLTILIAYLKKHLN